MLGIDKFKSKESRLFVTQWATFDLVPPIINFKSNEFLLLLSTQVERNDI